MKKVEESSRSKSTNPTHRNKGIFFIFYSFLCVCVYSIIHDFELLHKKKMQKAESGGSRFLLSLFSFKLERWGFLNNPGRIKKKKNH